jgi:hypothetical protein
MDNRLRRLYFRIKSFYGEVCNELDTIREEMVAETDLNTQADKVYALRETSNVAEELAKELRRIHTLASKLACLIEMSGIQDSALTEYCSGRARVTRIAKVPAKRRNNEEDFDKVMDWIGIPEEVYRSELVRPHWPNVQEKFAEAQEKGEVPPINVTEELRYEYSIRKRKEIS